MTGSERGHVIQSAAEVYEEFFVPALFQEWTSRVADAAGIRPGQHVLDVACGTGVLSRAVADRVGPAGSVVGLDLNPAMLTVAQRTGSRIEWRQGPAEALPFNNGSFDRVVSQFGLMFFEDRPAALKEMLRVLRPAGRMAVAVWDALEHSPGYAALAELLRRLFGAPAVNALRAPFVLGDPHVLQSLFAEAGIDNAEILTQAGTAHFPSISAWMYTEIKGWTLANRLDDRQFKLLQDEAERVLKPFVTVDGTVSFAAPAHIVTAAKA